MNWREEQRAEQAASDAFREAEYQRMQETPFAPSAGETIAVTLGGGLGLAIRVSFFLGACAVMFIIGRALVGGGS